MNYITETTQLGSNDVNVSFSANIYFDSVASRLVCNSVTIFAYLFMVTATTGLTSSIHI